MQSITINITKNFGKNICLELPNGSKHIITQSHTPYLYESLFAMLHEKEKHSSTLILPDDFEKEEPIIHFPNGKAFDGFKDNKDIPLENIAD